MWKRSKNYTRFHGYFCARSLTHPLTRPRTHSRTHSASLDQQKKIYVATHIYIYIHVYLYTYLYTHISAVYIVSKVTRTHLHPLQRPSHLVSSRQITSSQSPIDPPLIRDGFLADGKAWLGYTRLYHTVPSSLTIVAGNRERKLARILTHTYIYTHIHPHTHTHTHIVRDLFFPLALYYFVIWLVHIYPPCLFITPLHFAFLPLFAENGALTY